MSGFVKALESYVSGALSRDELFREVDRLLSHEADPSTLLASLYDEHARARLPGTLHGELVRKLLRHSAGPDLSRAWARTGSAAFLEAAVRQGRIQEGRRILLQMRANINGRAAAAPACSRADRRRVVPACERFAEVLVK